MEDALLQLVTISAECNIKADKKNNAPFLKEIVAMSFFECSCSFTLTTVIPYSSQLSTKAASKFLLDTFTIQLTPVDIAKEALCRVIGIQHLHMLSSRYEKFGGGMII